MAAADANESKESAIARVRREALTLLRELRYDEEIALMDAAIQQNPEEAELHQLRASGLWGIGRCDDSITALRRTLELAPRADAVRVILGNSLKHLGRSAEAIEVLGEGIKASPAKASHWLAQIGQQYEHVGDVPTAIAYYERALEADPEYAVARSLLAFAREGLQDEESV